MNNKKKLSYIDIKNETGLGIGTISRFFNGGSVSEKSKKILNDYIKKHNYYPDIGAKLIKGKDNTVYLVACSIEEKSILTIISSVVQIFKKENINIYIVVSSYDCESYKKSLEQTIRRKPKSLILLTPNLNDELIDYINNIEIDTYVFGSDKTNKPSICVDEYNLMFDLTKKIISYNYENIYYVGKDVHDITTGLERLNGHSKALPENKNIYLVKENNMHEIGKIWDSLVKNIDSKKTIIICGTHTIFKYMYFKRLTNNIHYDVTDIGYENDFDQLNNSYKFKIFIDFYEVGCILYKMIKNKEQTNYKLQATLIEK